MGEGYVTAALQVALRRAVLCVHAHYPVVLQAPGLLVGRERTVSLPAFLVDEIALHLARFPTTERVFTAPDGGPFRLNNFRRRVWKPAVAGSVGEPMRFHDLRHTHAALLIASGEHPKVIQSRLGHASIRTTLDTYGHLFDGLDEAAADRLDAVFRASHVDRMWTELVPQVASLSQRP